MSAVVIRRRVANDHDCLFTALAYLCEGPQTQNTGCARRLRALCAENVLDPLRMDPEYCEAVLGMPPAAYAEWIQNKFNWGGENEIIILSRHYKTEVVVVSAESLSALPYNGTEVASECRGRVYLLYTGQHFDPLVTASSSEASVAEEKRVHALDDENHEVIVTMCVELARQAREEAERKLRERRRKMIKCDGCGALLDDGDAFQEHCGEVEHSDDFMYTCSEVEIVEAGDDAPPDGRLDLSSPNVFPFYNTYSQPFSNFFASPITIDGLEFPTVEHYWQWSKFADGNPSFAESIRTAKSVDDAHQLGGAPNEGLREDWDDVKRDVALTGLRAKFTQHAELAAQLLETGDKQLVLLDTNLWAGINAGSGIPVGKNTIGQLLEIVRGELQAAVAAP